MNKKAFTLVELIVVIAILAVLMAGLAFYGSNSVKRTKLQTTENFLKILASDMETAYDDYGPYIINSALTEEEQLAKLQTFCTTLSDDYLHTTFNMDSLTQMEDGFTITTTEVDPWNSPYVLYYITAEDQEGDYIILSKGPDMVSNYSSYIDGAFGDDIVLSAAMKR